MTPDRGSTPAVVGSTYFGIPGWHPTPQDSELPESVALWAMDIEEDAMAKASRNARARNGSSNRGAQKAGEFSFTADAPEFVPFSKMGVSVGTGGGEGRQEERRSRKQREKEKRAGKHEAAVIAANPGVPITTLTISGIPHSYTVDSFRQQLDHWGLAGTYNFFFMPTDNRTRRHSGTAFMNFIDPTFAQLCQWICTQNEFEGTALPSKLQGLEANIAKWNQVPEDAISQPMVILMAQPTQWAVDSVNSMLDSKLSPQIREQFNKTKMCTFHKKRRCALGMSCPFAHSKEELQPPPDLFKTKLCYNFFRQRCSDRNCKFAHGYHELRATSHVYKTSICRWFANGLCKAGESCRYAHGLDELRGDVDAALKDLYGDAACLDTCLDASGMPLSSIWAAPGPGSLGVAPDFLAEQRAVEEEARAAAQAAAAPAADEARGDAASAGGDLSEALAELELEQEVPMLRQSSAPATTTVLQPREEIEDLESEMPMMPRHRSWSDGDLKKLCELEEALEGPWDL